MRYRLAIFDFDGTLADSFPWFMDNVNHLADQFGFRRIQPHEVDTLRGYDARRMIQHLRAPLWKLPRIARAMRARMAADIHRIPRFPGVDRLLRALHERGVVIAVVTTNSEANVRTVLGAENAALVRHYACGASLFGKARQLRQVLRASGVPAREAVTIGDEIRDLHAARAVGIPFCAVGWGFTHLSALAAHAPDHLCERMDDIVERLTFGA